MSGEISIIVPMEHESDTEFVSEKLRASVQEPVCKRVCNM